MYTPKLLTFSLLLLLLLSLSSRPAATFEDEDDDGIEELIALDEESESQSNSQSQTLKSSEAEVLAKAQRIVIELNHESTKRVIGENELVMVLGYAPWCERSAEMMPRFAEAAMKIRSFGSKVLMAKIDGERYSKVAGAIGIKGFPTLLLFINGTSQTYSGGFTSEEIVIWARKKTGEPVIRINSETGAQEFLMKHSMFVVGLFDKFEGPDYEEFEKTATFDNEIQFIETSSFEVARVLFPDIKPTSRFLGIVKSEPERYTAFEGTFKTEKMLEFVDINKFPLVTTVTELNSVRAYSSPIKLQVYVFADADDFKNLLESLQNIARKLKSEVMLLHVDIKEENLAKPFLTLFGLEDSEDTVVAAFDNKIGSKYVLESDPSPSKIEEFCFELLRGTLMPFYKSQPIPDNKEASIQTVVGKTFNDLVLSSPKNVFLEVHTPWCLNCETMAKNVEKLAKHFKGLDDLVFARIDLSVNEHPNLEVEDYPTLLLYLASDKSNPIKLSTKSSLKELAALINKNLKSQQDHPTKDEL